jgi:hypothetical protein
MKIHNSNNKFQTIIKKIVKNYFEDKFSEDLNVFDTVTKEFQNFTLNDKELAKLKKFLKIFLLGQIVGLPPLNCILKRFTHPMVHKINITLYVKTC